jgi:hypothetical protein
MEAPEVTEDLRTRITELEAILRRQRDTHDAFKQKVREVAISVREEMGWCLSGLNDRLEQLGLELVEVEWEVMATVSLRLTVTAADEDSARAQAEDVINDAVSYPVESHDVYIDSVEVTE